MLSFVAQPDLSNRTRRPVGRQVWCLLWVAADLTSCSGCGKRGDDYIHLQGAVTQAGAPVPFGIVYFDPDTSRDNYGPQGYALIQEGRYDTRAKHGRGIVGGPYLIRISGFDGLNRNEMQPYGKELFTEQRLRQELPREDGTVDFELP